MIDDEMLMPMKPVAKTNLASDLRKRNLPLRASKTDCLKWTKPPSRAATDRIAATQTPMVKPMTIELISFLNQSLINWICTYIKAVALSGKSAPEIWKKTLLMLLAKLTDLSTAVFKMPCSNSSKPFNTWIDWKRMYMKLKKDSRLATRKAEGKKKASSALKAVKKSALEPLES